MSARTESTPAARPSFDPAPVNVRVKIAGLWTAMLFVFAYVDLFSLYRADFRADLEAGEIAGFAITQSFLLAVTVYVVLPALMVFGCLVLPARVARITNVVLAAAYALTILGGMVGDANRYYLFGSVVEIALLAGVAFYAWTWPKVPTTGSTNPPATADLRQHATT